MYFIFVNAVRNQRQSGDFSFWSCSSIKKLCENISLDSAIANTLGLRKAKRAYFLSFAIRLLFKTALL